MSMITIYIQGQEFKAILTECNGSRNALCKGRVIPINEENQVINPEDILALSAPMFEIGGHRLYAYPLLTINITEC